LIAYFLSNISAKYYENPTMLSRVIAKNIGDVFLRHTVVFNSTWCHDWRWYSQRILRKNALKTVTSIRKEKS